MMIRRSNEEILEFFGLKLGMKIKWKDKDYIIGNEIYELKIEDGFLAFFDITGEYGFNDVVYVMAYYDKFEVIEEWIKNIFLVKKKKH